MRSPTPHNGSVGLILEQRMRDLRRLQASDVCSPGMPLRADDHHSMTILGDTRFIPAPTWSRTCAAMLR
jgi:hypothetical protein